MVEPDLVGTTVGGRYAIKRLIGRGGMGIVYEAEHTGLDKRIAIKFLHAGTSVDSTTLARFRREARIASKVAHANVVQIYDVGEERGRDFIVMEYVDGENLRSLMRRGPIAAGRAIAIAQQMLAGLDAVHRAGLVHRDIKPENVMLTAGDGVKLMDFGISKSIEPNSTGVTRTNQIIGTPRYMSPEQLMGLGVDLRTDLYAVGVTLFEMIAGTTPFPEDHDALGDDPPSLDQIADGVEPHVADAIARAIARGPNARFADAAAFSAALAGAGTVAATPHGRLERRTVKADARVTPVTTSRRSWWPIALALIATAALAAGITWMLRPTAESSPVAIVPARDAAIADVSRAAQHLAYAREALAAGNRRLAFEALKAAHAIEPTPELARELAALGEPPDAGSPDAAPLMATKVTRRPPEPQVIAQPATGSYCRCIAPTGALLCIAKETQRCRCQGPRSSPMCPIEYSPSNGVCPDRRYFDYRKAGTAGETCEGFAPFFEPSGSGAPRLVSRYTSGTLECHICQNPRALKYRGEPGGACSGFQPDGTRATGKLGWCSGKYED